MPLRPTSPNTPGSSPTASSNRSSSRTSRTGSARGSAANRSAERVALTLSLMLAGDALSVPLHWYYDHAVLTQHVQQHYSKIPGAVDENGRLCSIVGIPEQLRGAHPTSSRYFEKVTPRELQALRVLHGATAAEMWATKGTHYHATLQVGDNSTTSDIALLLMRHLSSSKTYDAKGYLDAFESFFETPGARRDLYVSEVHRHYFRNKAKGVAQTKRGVHEECASAMTLFMPLLAFLGAGRPLSDMYSVIQQVCVHVRLHHNTAKIVQQTTHIARLVLALWGLPNDDDHDDHGDEGRLRKKAARLERARKLIAESFQWFFAQMAPARKDGGGNDNDNEDGDDRDDSERPTVEFFASKSAEEMFLGTDAYALAGEPGSAHFSLR